MIPIVCQHCSVCDYLAMVVILSESNGRLERPQGRQPSTEGEKSCYLSTALHCCLRRFRKTGKGLLVFCHNANCQESRTYDSKGKSCRVPWDSMIWWEGGSSSLGDWPWNAPPSLQALHFVSGTPLLTQWCSSLVYPTLGVHLRHFKFHFPFCPGTIFVNLHFNSLIKN